MRGRSVELAYKTCVMVAVAAGVWWLSLTLTLISSDGAGPASFTERVAFGVLGLSASAAVAGAGVWLGHRIQAGRTDMTALSVGYAAVLTAAALFLLMLLLPLLWLPASWWLVWRAHRNHQAAT